MRPSAAFCIFLVIAFSLTSAPLHAQGDLQPRWLIDSPTAGLLPRRSLAVDFRFYEQNGILVQVEVGVLSRAGLGISFGGQHLVGRQGVEWNPGVEFTGRLRLIEEGYRFPALAVGYQSQGYGSYDDDLKRYAAKSKGFYAVMSKNFGSSYGDIGLHGGLNRSFENKDGDNDLSGFIGIEKLFGRMIMILMEYDFALNDNEGNSLGSGRGLFNLGTRWNLSSQLALEFDIKNIFQNGRQSPRPDRELRLVYFEKF